MLHPRACPICGTEFKPQDHRQKFCSRACSIENSRRVLRNRVTLLCEHCGKSYEQKPSLASTSHYCSRACQHAHRTAVGHITCICKVCGKPFDRRTSHPGDYCSYTCMGLAGRDRVTLTCTVCGVSYEVIKSWAESSRYCSLDCKHVGWAKTLGAIVAKRGPTAAESLVHTALETLGLGFAAQVPVGRYVVDFLLPERSIILEVDGDYWHALPESVARDQRKNAFLLQQGYTVIRVLESEVAQAASPTDLADLLLLRLTKA